MGTNTTTKTIGNVVKQARQKYEELMQSEYISALIKIDGIETRGQSQDNGSVNSTEDKNSKLMTCMLNIPVKRGSYIEMQVDKNDLNFSTKGIVTSIPNMTPVDYYFTALFFNAVVTRVRRNPTYNLDGDIIGDVNEKIESIPCYVERVGVRERQVDAGIEKNSVNKIITLITWDIKKGDVLYVGDNKYKITDIEELEADMLSAFMTFYRE